MMIHTPDHSQGERKWLMLLFLHTAHPRKSENNQPTLLLLCSYSFVSRRQRPYSQPCRRYSFDDRSRMSSPLSMIAFVTVKAVPAAALAAARTL